MLMDKLCLYGAALLCGGSDIPGTRKLGGFVGHQAEKGVRNAY